MFLHDFPLKEGSLVHALAIQRDFIKNWILSRGLTTIAFYLVILCQCVRQVLDVNPMGEKEMWMPIVRA